MIARDLIRRVTFLKPEIYSDPDGRAVQDYLVQFSCLAHVRLVHGTEVLCGDTHALSNGCKFAIPSTLTSKAWAIITLRDSAEARQITSDWSVELQGRTFRLQEDPRPEDGMLTMLVET